MAKGADRAERTPTRKPVGRRPGARRPVESRQRRGTRSTDVDELELRADAAETASLELEVALQRYVDLYDLAPIGYATLDRTGMICEINLAGAALLGRQRASLLGRPLRSLVAPTDRQKLSQHLSGCRSESGQVTSEVRLLRSNGEEAVTRLTSRRVNDLNGKPRLLTALVDLTPQRRAQTEAEHERALLESVIRQAVDGIIVCDPEGCPLLVNDAAKRIIGFDPVADVRSASCAVWGRMSLPDGTFLPVDRWPGFLALRGETSPGCEVRLDLPDGRSLDLLYNAAPVRDTSGRIMAAVCGFTDITARKQGEQALRESEQRLVADLDAMRTLHELGMLSVREGNAQPVLARIVDAAIAISGADFGNIQLVDPASGDLKIVAHRGFPNCWIEFWDSVSRGQGLCGTALERGERVIVEDVEQSPIFAGSPALEIQREAGVRAVQSTPLVDRSGKLLGMFSTHYKRPHRPDVRSVRLLDLLARQAADFIERAHIEGQLRASEARYRELVQNANSAIIRWARDGTITFFNEFAQSFFGYRAEEIVGRNVGVLIPELESNGHDLRQLVRNIVDHPEDHVQNINENVCRDGRRVWMAWTNKPLFDANGHITEILAVGMDITAQKKAEAALVRHRAWDRAKAAIGMAAVSGTPLLDILTAALDAVAESTGASIGLIHLVDPETRDLVLAAEQGVSPEQSQKANRVKWREDLEGRVAATGSGQVVEDTSKAAGLSRLMALADPPLGSLISVPLKAHGQVLGTLTLGHTERLGLGSGDMAEVQVCADMLAGAVRSERLREALHREADARALLLRELDHRVRNTLATLIGLLHLTAEKQPARTAAILQTTADRVSRLADVHAVLAGYPQGSADLGQLAERVAKSVLDLAEPSGRIAWSVVAPPIQLRPSKATNIALVLHELLTNCVKHAFGARGAGTVSVEVRRDGSTVGIAVCDNGRGPGSNGVKAGSGLAIVEALVTHNLQGEFWVAEARGGGTLVYVRFPAAEQTQPGGPS